MRAPRPHAHRTCRSWFALDVGKPRLFSRDRFGKTPIVASIDREPPSALPFFVRVIVIGFGFVTGTRVRVLRERAFQNAPCHVLRHLSLTSNSRASRPTRPGQQSSPSQYHSVGVISTGAEPYLDHSRDHCLHRLWLRFTRTNRNQSHPHYTWINNPERAGSPLRRALARSLTRALYLRMTLRTLFHQLSYPSLIPSH